MRHRILGTILFLLLLAGAAWAQWHSQPTYLNPANSTATNDNRLWHLDRIDQDLPTTKAEHDARAGTYEYCSTGQGIVVYLIDTGAWQGHSELVGAGKVSAALDFSANPTRTGINFCSGPFAAPIDQNSNNAAHGTSVASLAGGVRTGSAKGVEIVSLQVTPCPGSTADRTQVEAMTAAANWILSQPPRFAVVNFSTWVPQPAAGATQDLAAYNAFLAAVDALTAAGYPVIASANNYEDDACTSAPATLSRTNPGVISVGGSMIINDPDTEGSRNGGGGTQPPYAASLPTFDARWSVMPGDTVNRNPGGNITQRTLGSNFGDCVTLFAPARNITSAIPVTTTSYRDRLAPMTPDIFLGSGTSWAAPITAGVAARFLEMYATRFPGGLASLTIEQQRRDLVAAVRAALVNNATQRVLDPATLNSVSKDPAKLDTIDNNYLLRATDIFFLKTPDAEVAPGGTVTLQADPVTTLSSVQYRWYRVLDSGVAVPLSEGSGITGTVTPSLKIQGVSSRSRFFLRVTGQCDTHTVTRDSRIGLLRLKCSAPTAPTAGPVNVSRNGASVTLTATGTNVSSVRWYSRSTDGQVVQLPETTLSITRTPNGSAHYWYRAGDDSCFVDSEDKFVGGCNAQASVSISASPGTLVAPATQVTLTANVTNAPQFARVRWLEKIGSAAAYTERTDVSGNVLKYSFSPDGATQFARFKAVVTSPYCDDVTSEAVVLQNSEYATVGFAAATSNSSRNRQHTVVLRLTSATPKSSVVRVSIQAIQPNIVITPQTPQFPVNSPSPVDVAVTVAIPADYPEGGTITLKLVQPQNAALGLDTHTITVSDAVCSGLSSLSITGPQHVVQGQSVTLTPSFDFGDTYKWYIGSTLISQQKVLVHTPTADPTTYRLVVTCGAQTPVEVTHTVHQCYTPGVNVWPPAAYLHANDMPLFEALAAGATPLTYAWYRGSIAPENQIAHQAAVQPGLTAGVTQETFWVKVTDPCGLSAQNSATAYRCLPTFSPLPSEIVVAPGGSTTLTASASPAYTGQNPTIQWYAANDFDMLTPLATGSSYPVTLPAGTASRSYFAASTVMCGSTPRKERTPNSVVVRACTAPSFINYTTSGNSTSPGSEVRLLVNATGNAPLTYQWFKNGAAMSGKTSAELLDYPANSATYYCIVTSEGLCSIRTNDIPVSVCATPSITSITPNHTFWPEDGTRLDITATESTTTPLTYQWYALNNGTWVPITGATQNFYVTGPLSADVTFKVIVRAGACADERTVVATKCIYPKVVNGTSANIVAGDPFSLTLPVISPVYDKQVTWYQRTAGGPVAIASGINRSLTVNPTATTSYYAEFSHNSCQSRTNDYVATVCVPRIDTQPAGATITSGSSHVMTVGVTSGSFSYQWYIGNTLYTTTSVPSLAVSPSSTTTYWVRVIGCAGTYADSAPATVTVCVPPAAGITPTVATATQFRGNNASVSVSSSATAPAIQWMRVVDGVVTTISGATSATYDFSADATAYYFAYLTACGVQVNTAAVLHTVHPQVTSHPQSIAVKPGDRPVLTVAAYGTYLTYQWYVGNTGDKSNPITDGTGNAASYTTPAFTTQTSYWCEVRSASTGYAWSNAATVSRCTGPTVTNFTAQWPGYGNCWYLYAYVGAADLGNVTYQWYEGTPGNVAASTLIAETGSNYTVVCPNAWTTYWVRVWNAPRTCFSDTGGRNAYPVN